MLAPPSTYISAERLAEVMPDASSLLSDEPEMESSLHATQLLLQVNLIEWVWRERTDYFLGCNLTVYYNVYYNRQQLKNRDFRAPDLFVVKDVPWYPRPTWVVWEEGRRYQDIFRTPEYFWFEPETQELVGFRLYPHGYIEIPKNLQNQVRSWGLLWGSLTSS